MEREIDRRIDTASAVMRMFHRSVMVKKELSRKGKLLIYWITYIPTFTYGHRLCVVGGWALPQRQSEKLSNLCGAQSKAGAPPHQEETDEVAWVSG